MADVNNEQIDIEQSATGQAEQGTARNQRPRGSLFERRFMLYDHIKLSVKTLDIIIAVAAILLFATLILGIYKR